jgi:hypothetical protein
MKETLSSATHGHLRAGVAKSDLTTDRKDTVIRDRLYAKALVLDDGTTRLAIIAMDVTAIGGREISRGILPDVGEAFLPALRSRIQKELGIPGSNVLVNASHTHPPGRLLCDDAQQVERTLDAVRRASENLVAVEVGAGVGHEDRLTVNRTLRLKDGRCWSVRHTNPSPPDEEVAEVGPIDPDIGILRIDRLDGRPFAVVYNFACHLLFGDAQGSITANFPGISSAVIEESLGHEAMALFVQGAGGDLIDVGFKNFGQPRDIGPLGERLGLSALRAIRRIETCDATLRVINETVELPRRTDIPERITELKQEQCDLLESLARTSLSFKTFLPLYLRYALNPDYPLDDAHRYLQAAEIGSDAFTAMDALNRGKIEKYLANIRAMERLARIQDKFATLEKHQAINAESREATIRAEVQGLRIGDGVFISCPAELLVEVGLRIKRASPHRHTFIAAFSNGYLHYGPPADHYDRGGYEVTECLLAPEWQRIYEEKALEILGRL